MRHNNQIKSDRRTALVVKAFLCAFFVTAIPIFVLFGEHSVTFFIPLIAAVAVALYVWMYAADKTESSVKYILLSAVIFGAVGFAAGFFGPLIFAPQANQGPLLGIFVTGPIGILIGVIFGLVKSWRKNS